VSAPLPLVKRSRPARLLGWDVGRRGVVGSSPFRPGGFFSCCAQSAESLVAGRLSFLYVAHASAANLGKSVVFSFYCFRVTSLRRRYFRVHRRPLTALGEEKDWQDTGCKERWRGGETHIHTHQKTQKANGRIQYRDQCDTWAQQRSRGTIKKGILKNRNT